MTTTSKPKGFWQRPENITKVVMLFPIIALLVWGAGTLLPFVLLALQNTIYTIILGVVLLMMLVVLLDHKFWNRMGALYTIAMRWLTSFIVEIDPIAIIKGHLDTLKESLIKMDDQLNLLKGQETKLFSEITQNGNEVDKCLAKAEKAREKMNLIDMTDPKHLEYKTLMSLEANQAARLKASSGRLNEVLSKIVNLRKVLEKMKAQANYVYQDMQMEVKVKEKEFKAVGAGHKAFKQAMAVLQGNGLSKELYDESMEFIATDLGNKVGEIERFMENSGSMLLSMDVESEMFAEKGLKLLDDWTKKGDQLVLTSPKEALKLGGEKVVPVSSASFVNAGSTKSKYLN